MTDLQSPPTQISERDRVINALRGAIPATIAMPFVLSAWAPMWFVIAWVAAYAAVSAICSIVSLTHPLPWVHEWWPFLVAVLIALVPVSAVTFSDAPEHFWMSATVAMIFIAFQIAALPLLRIGEWRYGVTIVSLITAACALTVAHPLLAVAIAVVSLVNIQAGNKIGQLSRMVRTRLEEAELSLLHDPMTGLLNRRGLTAAIDALDGELVTVALIDLDHFKLVNDSHGHQVGDKVIIQVAAELESRFPAPFSVARLGGDEFVAVAPGKANVDESLGAPFRVVVDLHQREIPIDCSLSIGTSVGINDDEAQRLLSEAGYAMRQAKRADAPLQQFEQSLAEELDRVIQIAGVAGGGDEHGTFYPVGQLVVDNDRIVGCELLIRWLTTDGIVVMPGDFLSMASDAGLMVMINNTMLGHAVEFAARFNDMDDAPYVSVNISAPQLADLEFADRVEAMLDEHSVVPERLMVEITETHQLVQYSDWEITAHKLRTLGVQLAIDDFGRGYSSIERLHHLPISHIKFDRSLVVTLDTPFGLITEGVAQFAKSLDIGVIAEGIETDDEHEHMLSLGVSAFQGYFFHRPDDLESVAELVRERAADTAFPKAA